MRSHSHKLAKAAAIFRSALKLPAEMMRTNARLHDRHGGILASRASTWPRDHFCRRTIAPRLSRPTMWNEFLPISMPTTATEVLEF